MGWPHGFPGRIEGAFLKAKAAQSPRAKFNWYAAKGGMESEQSGITIADNFGENCRRCLKNKKANLL